MARTESPSPDMDDDEEKPIPLQAFRVYLVSLFATVVLVPSHYQPMVTVPYNVLRSWSLYNYSFFETLETLFVYAVIEPIYTAIFARNPASRIDIRKTRIVFTVNGKKKKRARLPKMMRPKQRLREMLIFVSPLLFLDLTMVKKYAGVSVSAIRESAGYATLNATAASNGAGDISGYFLKPTLHNFTADSPVQLYRALPEEAPSSRRLALELVASIVLYDALFFAIHLAFHRIPLLARFHMPHHRHVEMHPQVTNRLSVPERLALILLANFSLNIIGSHVLTRTAFVPLFVYMLIEVHSGVDLPWQYDKVLPSGWGAGARKHAAHHREGKRHFAPFFCWCDYALEYWDARWGVGQNDNGGRELHT